ncbi:MAG TPA: hypothetical protein PKD84_11405 [Propionicimonas sp.]|nr:hypothetical protein [Propionicimonas sp.]
MERHDPEVGTRITVRYTATDGPHEVIGYIVTNAEGTLRLQDRYGTEHELTWEQVQAWRVMPPPPPRRRSQRGGSA